MSKKKLISMKIDFDLLKQAKKIAINEKKSFTQLVTDILLQYIRNYNGEKDV